MINKFLVRCVLVAAAVLLNASVSSAYVKLQSGDFLMTETDMELTIAGRQVSVIRNYEENTWLINKYWSSLTFKYGANGAIASIDRIGWVFKPTVGSTTVFAIGGQTIRKTSGGFRWENQVGDWTDYDAQGNALKYGDRGAAVMMLKHNPLTDQIIGLVDDKGKQILTFEYTNGDLTAAQDFTGRRVVYTYNAAHYLTKVTDVLGFSWSYAYDNANRLASITNPAGHITLITYDLNTKVKSVKDKVTGYGETYEYNYDSLKNEYYAQVVQRDASVAEYWYNSDGILVRYSVNGVEKYNRRTTGVRARARVDAMGNEITEKFDEWGNLTERGYGDGSKVGFAYDANGFLLSRTDENGVATSWTYDAYGNVLAQTEAAGTPVARTANFTYDADGQLLSETIAGATTSYAYDANGNVTEVTDALGNKTKYTYDTLGNKLTETDANGNTISLTYDAKGNQLTRSDPLGNTTAFTYDGLDHIGSFVDAEGNTSAYTYDSQGSLTDVTDALGGVSKKVFDASGRVTSEVDEEGKVAFNLTYDAGRLTQYVDPNGNITIAESDTNSGRPSVIKSGSSTRKITYDKRNRIIGMEVSTDPYTSDKTTNTYDPAGNLIAAADASGGVTRYEYDALNRRIKTIESNGDTTTFAYDARDSLLSVTNAKGQVAFQYEYDLLGRKIKEIRPMGQITSYAYDAAGRMISKTDPNGKTTTMTYDAAGRVTSALYPAVNGLPAKTASYTYDKNGNMLTWSDGTYSGIYTYDALGRKLSTSINYGAFTLTSSQTYYKNGQKKSYTGADGVSINYTYNASNRLQTISIPGEGSFIYNSYNEFGPTKVTLPGGSTKNYTYDGTLRLTGINAKDPAGNNLMNYGYVYDASGNIVKKTTAAGDYVYGYDAADRLTSALYPAGSGLANETFTYDKVGNRISHSGSTAWVYNANDELISRPGVTYAYDLNGNMIKKTEGAVVTDYVYNGENRLSQVKQGTTIIASYAYDPSGRRISKTVNGITTYSFYSDEGLSAEADSTGTVLITYGHKPSQHGSNPLFTKIAGNYYYYLNDYQGMPQQMIAKNGAVVWKASTAAFGDLSISQSTVTNNIRFPGQYADSETGLYDNHFRKYDSQIGRYNRVDPAGFHFGGENSFLYAAANPLSNVDSLGLWSTRYAYKGTKITEGAHSGFIDSMNLRGFNDAVKDGSDFADMYGGLKNLVYQEPEYTYVHAMTGSKIKRKAEAYVLWVMYQRLMYQGFCNELPGGEGKDVTSFVISKGVETRVTKITAKYYAYIYIGMGLHAVADATSPVHVGFALWEGTFVQKAQHGPWWTSWEHIDGYYYKSYFAKTTSLMTGYLKSEKCSCEQ